MGAIYRGEVRTPLGNVLVKYQAARSAVDAERRAVKFDDPVWTGVRFRYVERCRVVKDAWAQQNQIVVLR